MRQAHSRVEIRLLDSTNATAYDEFICGIDHALLYYGLAWKAFLEDILDCTARYWLAYEANRITGVLPLMRSDGPYGPVINSLPFFGSHGGVIAITEAARHSLLNQYNTIVDDIEMASAILIENPFAPVDVLPIHNLTDERISQVTPLEPGEDAVSTLLKRIKGSARRNIRKAEESGVKVRVDNERINFLEKVHQENMVRIGGNAKPPVFFAKIANHFSPRREYDIYIAERNGVTVAALLIFYFNTTVEYFIPATVSSERQCQPMSLILRNAMVDASRRGFTRWNWGGTWSTQEGVYRFKKKWGAEDRRYRYFIWLKAREILKSSSRALHDGYPNFYVVPFSELRTT